MLATVAIQSRSASLSASLRLRLPGVDGGDLRAQQLHAKDVERLALDVDAAHEDLALAPKQRRHRRRRHAVLSRAGLGGDPRLAHPHREQRLAERVVHLVRAGMTKVLALEVDFRAAEFRGQVGGEVKRRRPADVLARVALQLGAKARVAPRRPVGTLQLGERGHQRLGDVAAAEFAETSAPIGVALHGRGEDPEVRWLKIWKISHSR